MRAGLSLLAALLALACGSPQRDFLEQDTKVDVVEAGAPSTGACGPERKPAVIVVVQNGTPAEVSVFEVDLDCTTESLRGKAPPAGAVSVSVFPGWKYRVRDSASGTLLKEFAQDRPGSITVP